MESDGSMGVWLDIKDANSPVSDLAALLGRNEVLSRKSWVTAMPMEAKELQRQLVAALGQRLYPVLTEMSAARPERCARVRGGLVPHFPCSPAPRFHTCPESSSTTAARSPPRHAAVCCSSHFSVSQHQPQQLRCRCSPSSLSLCSALGPAPCPTATRACHIFD